MQSTTQIKIVLLYEYNRKSYNCIITHIRIKIFL